MLKNRFFGMFAVIAMVGLAACAGEEEGVGEEGLGEEAVVAEPVTAPVAEPVVTEGAVGEGVVGEGAVGEGAATEILGNGIDDDGDGLIDEEV